MATEKILSPRICAALVASYLPCQFEHRKNWEAIAVMAGLCVMLGGSLDTLASAVKPQRNLWRPILL